MVEVLLVDCYPDDYKDRIPHYLRVVNRAGRVSITVDYRSVRAGFSVPEVRAAVVTGSPIMLSEEAPPTGLCEFVELLSCPILGICFGHQLLGFLTGVRVRPGGQVRRMEKVRMLRPSPLFTELGTEMVMLENHREYLERGEVERAGWEVLADSDSCPVEAMRHRTRPWYGVQFHPERSNEPGAILVENFIKTLQTVSGISG